ncbi:MAG: 4Fe-4S dicluster-binding protein [Candidatus Woesearchaeota archaeon]
MEKASQKKEKIGAITEAASSLAYETGTWKVMRPIWDKSKCTHCMQCPIHCPEDCIPVKEGKRLETNLKYCKGCGICAQVCPVKCIAMKPEADFE